MLFRLLFYFLTMLLSTNPNKRREEKNIYCFNDRENIFSYIFMIFFSFFSFVFFLACAHGLTLTLQHSQAGKIIHHILAHSQTLHQINFSSSVCWMKNIWDLKRSKNMKKKKKIKNSSCFWFFVSWLSFHSFLSLDNWIYGYRNV